MKEDTEKVLCSFGISLDLLQGRVMTFDCRYMEGTWKPHTSSHLPSLPRTSFHGLAKCSQDPEKPNQTL